MKTVVEPLEGNKVKLSVEIDEQEFEKALDAAFRKIAREVRIPGFRPGKAPRRVLEARMGKDTARQEAIRDALPDYYAQALREHEVDAIAPPEIDITAGKESGSVSFDAVVEVRPQLNLAGYGGLRVTVPNPEVAEDEIQAQIDRLRDNFAELSPVSRPARDGDHLTIDLKGFRLGQPVADLTYEDYLYELGSRRLLRDTPEVDDQLQGARTGDIFTFDAEMPDGKVEFRVLVKDVKEKLLPDVTDDWAGEASEFDTVEELRADIVKRMGLVKRIQAQLALRNQAVEALVELVTEDPPEPLVQQELERRAQDLEQRLASQGANIAQYLEASGQTEEQVVAELKEAAAQAVKADLALRAVADGEGIEASDSDVEAEITRLAERLKQKPAQLRKQLERAEQMPAVRSDVRKSKALEWLVDRVEVVDEEGHLIDRALLLPEPEPAATAPDTSPNLVETGEAEA